MTSFLKKYSIVSQTILVMSIFGMLFASLLAIFFEFSNPVILKSEAEAKQRLLLQVIGGKEYDNNLDTDFIDIPPNAYLKNKKNGKAYVARYQNKVRAVVLESRAPDGYSGDIILLVGISSDGEIIGSRVVKHQETPGLGDYIDIEKSNWILAFQGLNLSDKPSARWAVKKDRGDFDYMAGATITARGAIKAVHNALLFFKENKAQLVLTNVK